ncbi:pimeloyl-ACP methyl ester carboxylesterase [Flavobacterium arsenatis]|uniref:Pimeloyl-ACP methyl ester carboxylesterase n=1 Tax=Flavobacterium arsenatis TaxID=1484332 RepID=A0ABU1TPE2_9FLAO|nr:alpha/beta fold hydrolase [Flavobacterium arsenatis]MDR6967839.1 pimeloyl-ACP methyl ester carboxylesterase [Flavobacterium arsenatis]
MKKLKYFILTKSIGLYINSLSYIRPKKASHLAYRLFSEPRIGKLTKEKLPLALQDAKTETFYFNDNQFESYFWQGNENVILLIHGWESNASRWEKLLPYLKKTGSTIVAIDAPAHGLSAGKEFNVPTYAAFIDVAVQKFQPNFLIGHSIGGAACVYYQHKYQNNNLKKMVLLGAPSDLKTLITNYVALLSLNNKMVQLLENHFLQKFKFKFDDFSGQIFGKSLTIEGLIAHDIDDTIVAFDEGKKIASSWKNATFIETKGLGHSMHDDELYQKITSFLVGAKR